MPPIAQWPEPIFTLTNPFNGSMDFNVQTASGLYLLRQSECSFDIAVRSTKSHVPQADGDILHRRFLTGSTIQLSIQLMESEDKFACGAQLETLLDELSGALRSLLNAGDNEGRLAWTQDNGPTRMLDDVRLEVYPAFTTNGADVVVKAQIDSKYPYAQDLNQTCTFCADGTPETITNDGTAEYLPVFLVNVEDCPTRTPSASAVNDFTITVTQGPNVLQFVYLGNALPGGVPISAGGHYAEINTFNNTIYLDGNGANLKAGVDELNSEYMPFPTGTFDVQVDGCNMIVLSSPAWG